MNQNFWPEDFLLPLPSVVTTQFTKELYFMSEVTNSQIEIGVTMDNNAKGDLMQFWELFIMIQQYCLLSFWQLQQKSPSLSYPSIRAVFSMFFHMMCFLLIFVAIWTMGLWTGPNFALLKSFQDLTLNRPRGGGESAHRLVLPSAVLKW